MRKNKTLVQLLAAFAHPANSQKRKALRNRLLPGQNDLFSYLGRTNSFSLPDENVIVEVNRGQDFFKKFGLSAQSENTLVDIDTAVTDLSRRRTIYRTQGEIDVSIIIPVFGQTPFLLNCLDSLASQESEFSAEILVGNDASPACSGVAKVQAIPWVKYVENAANLGFLENCNALADSARGSIIVFLNSDTRVCADWLSELVRTFSAFPKAGLVGSKLFNEDLSLQEAGGLFWGDGSAWNYGRGDDPNNPFYCYARQVDYCSGAALAVRRDVWEAVSGFDPLFHPAYCEDADLAFKVRMSGWQTWFQATARVVHYEGRTHGTDLSNGMKAYQSSNLLLFKQKWKTELFNHFPPGSDPHAAARRLSPLSILVADATTPTPDKDSGSIVTAELIKCFQALGYVVIFAPLDNLQYFGSYSDDLLRNGVQCLYAPFVRNVLDLAKFAGHASLVLVSRYAVATTFFQQRDPVFERVPTIFHNQDLHYLRAMREARLFNDTNALLRAEQTKTLELKVLASVDCAMIISKSEIAQIKTDMPETIDHLIEAPFTTDIYPSLENFEKRRDIVFLAGFNHPPNVDAARFLLGDIWPLISHRLPDDARLILLGSEPTEEIQAFASERVVVTGFVKDLGPIFASSRVSVVPLRYGAGVKGKVLKSMAYGVPTVTTSIGAEGIEIVSNLNAMVSDSAANIADNIVDMYFSKKTWTSVRRNAFQLLERDHSHQAIQASCQRAVEIASQRWKEKRIEEKKIVSLNGLRPQALGAETRGS